MNDGSWFDHKHHVRKHQFNWWSLRERLPSSGRQTVWTLMNSVSVILFSIHAMFTDIILLLLYDGQFSPKVASCNTTVGEPGWFTFLTLVDLLMSKAISAGCKITKTCVLRSRNVSSIKSIQTIITYACQLACQIWWNPSNSPNWSHSMSFKPSEPIHSNQILTRENEK